MIPWLCEKHQRGELYHNYRVVWLKGGLPMESARESRDIDRGSNCNDHKASRSADTVELKNLTNRRITYISCFRGEAE